MPSTEAAVRPGEPCTGMPPWGKNGLKRTHGAGPREVRSRTVAVPAFLAA
jgi:hypothetical protein